MSENFAQIDAPQSPPARLPLVGPLIAFVILFFIALYVDKPLAAFLHESGRYLVLKNSHFAPVLKFSGDWPALVLTLFAAFFLHKSRVHALVFSAAAALIPLSNGLLKWSVGRHRPYRFLTGEIDRPIPWNCLPFRDGLTGLFKATNLSFASGHAAMAFTLATTLAILFPKLRILFFVIAAITACERFMETAHWASDTVAGAAMGYFGVCLIARVKFFRNSLSTDCRKTKVTE